MALGSESMKALTSRSICRKRGPLFVSPDIQIFSVGLDDWLPLAAVEGIARRSGGGTNQEIRERSIEAIRELAQSGFVQIGEVPNSGFFEWV